jgi:peroxidase
MNQNTHWLDGSTIYGSDEDITDSLRSWESGQLLTSTDSSGRQLLPVTSNCTNGACFIAGDSRATEQPLLTLMHTLWMREHNRVARRLASLNPTWTDETIFQEARRIVIAELQHITYAEWLPNLLGNQSEQNCLQILSKT